MWSVGALSESNQSIPRISTRDRLHQICRYLSHKYRIKVRLRVESIPKDWKCLGCISYDNSSLPPLIRIDKGLSRSESISTLIHEFAHAVSHRRHGCAWKREYEGHDAEFALVQNEIENLYFYEDGDVESLEF
jgi:hypothetical protein